MNLNLRPKEECTFDEISLGEIMLRLNLRSSGISSVGSADSTTNTKATLCKVNTVSYVSANTVIRYNCIL